MREKGYLLCISVLRTAHCCFVDARTERVCVHCQNYLHRGREEGDQLPNFPSVSVLRNLCSGKQKGKEVKKRVVEAFIAMCNALNLADVYLCLCMYTSAFFLYLVLCPVSCLMHGAFLFECTQSNRLVAKQWQPCVFSFMAISLCRNFSAQPKDVLLANAVNPADVL